MPTYFWINQSTYVIRKVAHQPLRLLGFTVHCSTRCENQLEAPKTIKTNPHPGHQSIHPMIRDRCSMSARHACRCIQWSQDHWIWCQLLRSLESQGSPTGGLTRLTLVLHWLGASSDGATPIAGWCRGWVEVTTLMVGAMLHVFKIRDFTEHAVAQLHPWWASVLGMVLNDVHQSLTVTNS